MLSLIARLTAWFDPFWETHIEMNLYFCINTDTCFRQPITFVYTEACSHTGGKIYTANYGGVCVCFCSVLFVLFCFLVWFFSWKLFSEIFFINGVLCICFMSLKFPYCLTLGKFHFPLNWDTVLRKPSR